MSKVLKFRELRPEEIEVRAAQCKADGASILLYKDARVDMAILDETVGAMNWQRSHTRDNANCIVSIWDDEKQQWISKEDTGSESNTEKEKGLCSDSFKRACFNWGIGRSLYTVPFIWLNIKCKQSTNGKYSLPYKIYVSKYETDCGRVTAIELKDEKGNVVYKYSKPVNKVDYSSCSTGTTSYKKDPVQSVKLENNDEDELPDIYDTDEDLCELPFGPEEAGKAQDAPVKPVIDYSPDDEDDTFNPQAANITQASIFTSKNGNTCVKIVYAYKNRFEEKTQIQTLNNSYGFAAFIKQLKAMKVMPDEELNTASKDDLTIINKAIDILNETAEERDYEVEVSKNAKNFDVFSVTLL